jgi:hypothetical protein
VNASVEAFVALRTSAGRWRPISSTGMLKGKRTPRCSKTSGM